MKLIGELSFPGDKSLSHRVLMLGSVAGGVTRFTNCATGQDVQSTARCLQDCGIEITLNNGLGSVTGNHLLAPAADLNCGNSGTSARLLAGLLSGQGIAAKLTGDTSLSARPMARILKPLELMGARISARRNRLPLTLSPAPLQGISYTLPVASAQVKSAILLAGLGARGVTTLTEFAPSRDHTENMLVEMGAALTLDGSNIRLDPAAGILHGITMQIPGDPSTAAFFAAAAAICPGSDLRLQDILANPTRTGLFSTLGKMQVRLEWGEKKYVSGEPVADLRIRPGELQPVELHGADIPALIDELPILAIVATQAAGITTVTGAGELRVKETDRIRAICTNLKALGAQVEEHPDGFCITGPTRLHGGHIQTNGDHRIAMAFSVAGLIATGKVVLDDPECMDVSCPEFNSLLGKVLV